MRSIGLRGIAVHGECLTRRSLAIGEDCLVDSIEGILHQIFDLIVEDGFSGDLWPKHLVKGESLIGSRVD